jgi:hypothetical protein
MTFETVEQVIELIKKFDQVPKWVEDARKYHKDLKALVYGEEFAEKLLRIEHIESEKRAGARKKYSRSIQDLNERLLRLIDNVYTATGGSKEYKFPSEASKKQLIRAITNNRDGKSLEKWLQTFWSKDLYIVDPSGVVFLEYLADSENPPYPTYKSIDNIRSYEHSGQNLEWILFEPQTVKITDEKEITYIRFVDDETDYRFIKDSDTYFLVEELTFDHPFGKCPGLLNSNIERLGNKKIFSLIDNLIGMEEEMLRDQSVLTIYKFQNGFATPIRPVILCPSCHGRGKTGTDSCADCDGKGIILNRDVTDEISVPVPLDKDLAYNLPPGLFTYMSPDLETWDQYIKEFDRNEIKCSNTLWGTHKERFENERTAFETFVDTQPVTTKLSEISEVAEFMEHQLTEWIANYISPTKDKDEPVTIISYGKTFIIEPPEAIMEKYRTNKEAGVSTVVLDRQLFEYITSKYKNNPRVLFTELLKKELEYYVHFSVDEVQTTMGQTEAQKKMLFTDWWETIDTDQLMATDVEKLKAERDKWADEQLAELETSKQSTEQNTNQNTNQNE